MDGETPYAILRISDLVETPERIEVTLMTTQGPQVLTFSDPNHDRTMRLLGDVAALIGSHAEGSSATAFAG